MNELPKKIEHIIAQRQPLAGKLTIAERHLSELSEALYSLEKPYCNLSDNVFPRSSSMSYFVTLGNTFNRVCIGQLL